MTEHRGGLGLIVFLALVGLALVACVSMTGDPVDSGAESADHNDLSGTWVSIDGEVELVFDPPGQFYAEYADGSRSDDFEMSGTLLFYHGADNPTVVFYEVSADGQELCLTQLDLAERQCMSFYLSGPDYMLLENLRLKKME